MVIKTIAINKGFVSEALNKDISEASNKVFAGLIRSFQDLKEEIEKCIGVLLAENLRKYLNDFDFKVLGLVLDKAAKEPLAAWYVAYVLNGGKRPDKAFYMRVRRSLEKLQHLELIELRPIGRHLWVYVGSSLRLKFEVEKDKSLKSSVFQGKAKAYHVEIQRNVLHNRALLETVLAYLYGLRLGPQPIFKDLKISRIKNKWIILGCLKLGDWEIPFMVRYYGFNQTVTRGHIKRDMDLFKEFRSKYPNGWIIVFSASWIEGKPIKQRGRYPLSAQELLKRKVRASVFTIGWNIRMPYIAREKRMERHRKAHYRFKKGHEINPKRPKNPPHVLGLKDFRLRFLSEGFNAVKKFKTFIEDRIFKRNLFLKVLVEEYREAKALYLKAVHKAALGHADKGLREWMKNLENILKRIQRRLNEEIEKTFRGNGG